MLFFTEIRIESACMVIESFATMLIDIFLAFFLRLIDVPFSATLPLQDLKIRKPQNSHNYLEKQRQLIVVQDLVFSIYSCIYYLL